MPVKDPNALAKLQAYANGGQAAVDAWNRSQAVANQAQQAALSTAGSVATNGAAEQAALSKIVGDYTSPTQGALSSGADFAVTEASNYSRAGQSELRRTLDELNAKQARADAKRKLDLELAQQDYDLGMTKVRNENDLTQRQANQLTAAQVNDAVMAGGQQLQAADRDTVQKAVDAKRQEFINDESKSLDLQALDMLVKKSAKGEQLSDVEKRSMEKISQTYGVDTTPLLAAAQSHAASQGMTGRVGGEANVGSVPGPLGRRTDETIPEMVARTAREAQAQAGPPQSLAEAAGSGPSLGGQVRVPMPDGFFIPTPVQRQMIDENQAALDRMLRESQSASAAAQDTAGKADAWGAKAIEGIDVNPMFYQQRAATAGGMDPWVAMGAYPDTPTERFKQQQALDAMRDYDAKRQLAEDKRDVQGDKTNRTQQINDLAEATGYDPTAVQSLVTKTKLPPDKLGTVLRDDQSLGELQQAVDAALGNGTTYTEFMNSMRDQLTAKQKAGQMPEGMTVTDYLNFIGANYRDQFTQLGLTGG